MQLILRNLLGRSHPHFGNEALNSNQKELAPAFTRYLSSLSSKSMSNNRVSRLIYFLLIFRSFRRQSFCSFQHAYVISNLSCFGDRFIPICSLRVSFVNNGGRGEGDSGSPAVGCTPHQHNRFRLSRENEQTFCC